MKRRKIRLVLSILLLLSVVIYFFFGFVYSHSRNIESEKPEFTIASTQFFTDYSTDTKKADSLYLNKTIEIKGTVTKQTDSVIILDHTIFCLFTKKTKTRVLNNVIKVKGKCIGYDELFNEVKLDQCSINK